MLPANKTTESVDNAALYQHRFKREQHARQQAESVLDMLEALRLTSLDNKQQEFLKIAHDSANTLLALINDILDFSKIEVARMSLESIHFDLHCLLDNVLQLWQSHVQEKNLYLDLQINDDVPQWLIGDPTRINQILTNLVSNAVKFTSNGGITIQCDALTPVGVDPAMLRFTVQDTGIGMNDYVCKRLFNAFEQAEGAATTRVYGGTGLGLVICKQLTQLMEGEISVESTPGAGSCFMLILPCQLGIKPMVKADPATIKPTNDNNQQHHLLVVDDNETNRRVASAILEHLGFITHFACDGIEAINAVQTGQFSLILMDCHMPLLDGFQATQAIRNWEQETGHSATPIIAVSASAYQEDREHCSAAGMNDFVPKPVTLGSLQAMAQRWLATSISVEQNNVVTHKQDTTSATTLDDADIPAHLFDREQLAEMKLVTGTQFNTLIEKFCNDSLLQIQGMRDATSNFDAEALRKCAHKLKGSAASIGAKVLSKHCHRVEERARAGDINDMQKHIDTIEVCLNQVIVVVRKIITI